MKVFKLIILIFLSITLFTNTFAQDKTKKSSVLADYIKENYPERTCKPLSEEELQKITGTINEFLYNRFVENTKNIPTSYPKIDIKNIFSDNPYVQSVLETKYKDYENILIKTNWKNTHYANLQPQKLNEKINILTEEIRNLLKDDPFYKSNKFASHCDNFGLIMTDFAVFYGLGIVASAALPAATTVTQYSAISGLAWDFSPLFKISPFLQGTGTLGKVGSLGVGFAASLKIFDEMNSYTKKAWNILEDDQTMLGAQKNIIRALKTDFNLDKQIEEIKSNTELSQQQKQRRIETRYKETIIKIYALDYIKTYIKLSEKPEKYLWALLDLISLLQSQNSITFGYENGETITVEPLPRLIERSQEMQITLMKLITMQKNGFGIKSLGKHYTNIIREDAEQNVENYFLNDLDKSLNSN